MVGNIHILLRLLLKFNLIVDLDCPNIIRMKLLGTYSVTLTVAHNALHVEIIKIMNLFSQNQIVIITILIVSIALWLGPLRFLGFSILKSGH